MHRLAVLYSFLGSFALLGCTLPAPDPAGEDPGHAEDSIINGTQDNAHTAVVALFSQQSECTGTILQVKGGNGYVLTAAHCCTAQDMPQWVLTGVDYDNPTAVYGVVPGSVTQDPGYNPATLLHDFCMLQFSGAPANMPFIPPATSQAQDGLQVGSQVEFVGYGVAGTPQNHDNFNSIRNHITGALDQLDSLSIAYDQQANNGGPCSGDSGGPALVQPGTPQAQQLVVGVTSYGDVNCAQYGVSGRVSGVYNGFIGPYLNGQPILPPQDCQTCATNAQQPNGACGAQTQACLNNQACADLSNCLQGCSTQACVDGCANQFQAGINDYNNFVDCICYTGCTTQCAAECGPPPSNCGLQSSDADCNTCLESKCCAQAQACANDQACVDCLVPNAPASCSNNGPLNQLAICITSNCNTECNGGSSSSSSTTSTGSGPGTTTTGVGGAPGTTTTGVGGAPGTGGAPHSVGGAGPGGAGPGGAGGSGGDQTKDNDTGTIGGCGCEVAGGDEGSTSPMLAGLALAAALTAARRRRTR
jgi:MYXO-CTERM domain-containing protein